MQVEQLSHGFEENEITQIRERAEAEGWKEKLDAAKLHPEYRLMTLESRIDKTTQDFETRLSILRSFVEENVDQGQSDEAAPSSAETELSPKEFIAEQKEKLTQDFRQELAGGDDFDITNPKDWKGSIALMAFDWLQESKKTASDPDAGFTDRIMAGVMSFFGGIGMKMFAGDSYEKFEKSLNGLSDGSVLQENTDSQEITDLENIDENSSNDLKYRGVVEVLKFLTGGRKDNQEFTSLMNESIIKNTKIKNFGKDNNLYESLRLKAYEDSDINNVIQLLSEGKIKMLIENIMQKSDKKDSYSELTLEETINLIGKDIFMLKKIGSGNFDIADIDFGSEDENESDTRNEKMDISLLFTDTELKGTVDEVVNKIMGDEPEHISKKNDITKIIKFGFSIQEEFISNTSYHLTSQVNLTNILANNPLTATDAAKLFYITGGEPQLHNLNSIQQSMIYFNMLDILDDRHANGENGAYMVALIENITEQGSDEAGTIMGQIPDGVKDLLQDQFLSFAEQAQESIKNLGETLWGAFKQNKVVGSGIIAAALILPIFSKRTSVLGSIFGK